MTSKEPTREQFCECGTPSWLATRKGANRQRMEDLRVLAVPGSVINEWKSGNLHHRAFSQYGTTLSRFRTGKDRTTIRKTMSLSVHRLIYSRRMPIETARAYRSSHHQPR